MRLYFLFLLIVLIPEFAYSQKRKKLDFGWSFSVGVAPILLSGPMDKGTGNGTMVDSRAVTSAPVYRHVDTTAIVINGAIHLACNIPVYRKQSWSAGVRLHAGVGHQLGVKAAEGFTSVMFDFPQYIYFRKHKNTDYSFLAGFKYTYTAIPYAIPLVRLELNFDHSTLGIYGSPVSSTKYALLTNGELRPAIKIYEFGMALNLFFQ